MRPRGRPRDNDEENISEGKLASEEDADYQYYADERSKPRGSSGPARRPLDSHRLDEIDSEANIPSSNASNLSEDIDDAGGPSGSSSAEEYERVPPSNDPMMQCLIVRDRSGTKMFNPEYNLYLQEGRKRGSEKLLLIAKKRSNANGTSYHIYNVSRGFVGAGRLKKKGGNYVGKLKCSKNKAENVMYNNEERKEELGGVLYEKPTIMDHMKDGAQPRKLKVILPAVSENNVPIPHSVNLNDPMGGLLSQIMVDDIEKGNTVLERKEPVFENGNYRLNFHGRVTVPSVKNFQLVNPRDVDDVICQFGKVDDDRFHLDFKGPMNAYQAFAVALSQFNY